MLNRTHSSIKEIINSIVAYARKQLSTQEGDLLAKFIPLYFINASLDDVQNRSTSDLYGMVFSHWELMKRRTPGEIKVRVFNPQYESEGWQSTHTVIQVAIDDMPFLVDSIRMTINRLELTTHLMIYTGGIKICRDKKHVIEDMFSYHERAHCKAHMEAPIYMEIDRQNDAKKLNEIEHTIRKVLDDVTIAVTDWQKMQERARDAIHELNPDKMIQNPHEVKESRIFLEWLLNGHFTFLGFRAYERVDGNKDPALRLIPGSGLGVLRDHTHSKMLRQYSSLPPEARKIALSPERVIILSKTNTISTVHRPVYSDYVGVKRFNSQGQLIGEWRFVGLYTSEVYRMDPRTIPIVRNKVAQIMKMSGLPEKGHAGKDLIHIISTLPRDDLFLGTTHELYEWSMGILHLQERRHIRLFVRKDAYGRFVSCLVYVPREYFTTDLVLRMQDLLVQAFQGLDVSFTSYFSESVLARIHFLIRIDPRRAITYDVHELEKKLIEIGISWEDGFRNSMLDYFGEERGNALFVKYRKAFPVSYRESFKPRQAVFDVEQIEQLSKDHPLGMSFYRPLGAPKHMIRFKLFRPDFTVPLSDALPMLENMGLRVIEEQPYEVTFSSGKKIWINDFSMTYAKEPNFNVEEVRSIFQEAFEKIWFGEADDDSLNQLVLETQLNWREIYLLRAYAKYFRQIGVPFSEGYIASTLVNNPKIVQTLIELFKYYFDPSKAYLGKERTTDLEHQILKDLEDVIILDEDRILRKYLDLMHATLRTNYFQVDERGGFSKYLAFKLDPRKIPDMPMPLPKYEIFVYSPRIEGVHLRAAKVARGGIRWSDRREDYRTEILGLMKAQQVKNAVIVPEGAKGGFIAKKIALLANREEILQEGIVCYEVFIRGLLDLTDNLINGKNHSPPNTVCYDGPDHYLVVAADKGTATFSDIANRISLERHFWMGDAFASGGSTGYDHKKMAITARGAWVSAEQHFQELGINIDETDITVVGIGDMSGDVFGNGMLLSQHIKLIGAFDHRHIFLDPDPSPGDSYKERLRLFNLSRSSWDDYDRTRISKGGGVYSRSAKAIRLSEEIKKSLSLDKDLMEPNELIRALLKAPVDLIWNGGIGTYVKHSLESNTAVVDRSNDNVRINANELRARVVCEGGNLGVTQLGRIEFDLNGGKINTDFIDNSAGVDCSDHEVNIKILLNSAVLAKEMTEQQRNELLSNMKDEVADLVLTDNYDQNKAISFASYSSQTDSILYMHYLEYLEQQGKIDRQFEFLPDAKTLIERRATGIGLTRPELCVLFAYSKIILKDQIKKTALVQDPYLSLFVRNAFPKELYPRFEKYMLNHTLAKEIIATQLSNRLVSEMGITFAYQMQDETGLSISQVVRSYAVATEIFKLQELLTDIKSLDYRIQTGLQHQMNGDAVRLVRRAARWFLRNRREHFDIASTITHFSESLNALADRLPKLVLGADKVAMDQHQQKLVDKGVPKELATKIASLTPVFHALNIIEAATMYHEESFRVAKIYFMLADRLNLFWFRELINSYPTDNRWAILARSSYKGDLDWIQRELTVRVLLDTKARSIPGKIKEWLNVHNDAILRWQAILTDLRNVETKDFAILFVAIRELWDLASTPPSNHNLQS